MTEASDEGAPPWAELLHAAFHAAYRTMTLESEERLRAYQAAQAVSDARMEAGRAVGRARRAGWDGNHTELWKAAETLASVGGSLKQFVHGKFLDAEHERWRNSRQTGGQG